MGGSEQKHQFDVSRGNMNMDASPKGDMRLERKYMHGENWRHLYGICRIGTHSHGFLDKFNITNLKTALTIPRKFFSILLDEDYIVDRCSLLSISHFCFIILVIISSYF